MNLKVSVIMKYVSFFMSINHSNILIFSNCNAGLSFS